MNSSLMYRPTPCSGLPWLAVGLLLSAAIGCSQNDGSATATATATPLAGRSSLLVERAAERVTPSPAAVAAETAPVSDAESVQVNTEADPDSGGAPLTVQFKAEVEGGPAGLSYRWEFGDNTPAVRQRRAEHTYQQPGEYTATFWVTGPGVEQSEEVSIEVNEEGFEFDIETDSDVGTAPLTVEFTARMDEDLPGPFYFAWDFGDGGRDVSNPTNHTYRKAGEYTATVTVTNAQGQRASRDVQIQVDAPDDATE
jgi:PKD repeat protein